MIEEANKELNMQPQILSPELIEDNYRGQYLQTQTVTLMKNFAKDMTLIRQGFNGRPFKLDLLYRGSRDGYGKH